MVIPEIPLRPSADPSSSTDFPTTGLPLSHLDQYTPYALHHSDTSNLVLVSELLTDDNYVSWSRSMVLTLFIQNKLGFIDGSLPRPTGDLLHLWIHNNNVVVSWILKSVSKSISSSILFTESAQAIWLDLQDCFQRRNGPRIFHLKRELSSLKQDQDSVTMYFTKMKSFCDEYVSYRPGCTCGQCTCGGIKSMEDFLQFEYLLCFFMGLNDSFNHTRSQLLLMDPPPPLNKAFSFVFQQEQHQSLANPPSSVVTLTVQKNDNPLQQSYKHKGRSNQVHKQHPSSNSFVNPIDSASSSSPAPSGNMITNDTLQQLLTMLQSKLNMAKAETDSVTHVAEFQYNLLSISALTFDGNVFVHFSTDSCDIQAKSTLKTIGKGRLRDGLLGHPSLSRLSALKHVLRLDFVSLHSTFPCDICPLGKQKKLSFELHNNRSSAVFDLIHANIWGPFSTPTHVGHKFFLTIVDDHSRFTWVFMLKSKSGVLKIIPQFFSYVETQYDKKIKVFRSDNAPELSFVEFFLQRGVLHQYSCVGRPEQNSVVERKHQHLLNVSRALFFQSRAPLKFWNECVLTAVYLINRTSSPILGWKTPYDLLQGTLADYSLIRTFRCLCFASTLSHGRSKFSPRVVPAFFIGYPPGMKAYKLFDITSNKLTF
ncbi:uncharacterized protein LOC120083929 [Benincasa hispida]|uniref:uncharacterized protein LOC120083929 n=1 Tax=Benincasa hispida TaxID=102211 RepID=UPI0018FF42D5|nr:uncharacterized protein LOC120083929 [Benincasa hispida]